MSEIGPGRLMEALVGPIDAEQRRTATAAPETAFADLLRTASSLAPPLSAEAFEANDLVGRAGLSLVPGAPETHLRFLHKEGASPPPSHIATFQIDEVEVSPEAVSSNPASAPVDIRAYGAGAHKFFVESTPTRPHSIIATNEPALKSAATPAGDLPDLPVALQPTSRSATGQAPTLASVAFARPATTPGAPYQPPPPSSPASSFASLPPAPPRETSSNPITKTSGNPVLEKIRNLVFERAQANTSAVHVAMLAADNGVRIVVRAGGLHDAERTRLKESIAEMLAQHGLSDVDIVIQTSSPAGAGARQG